MKDMDWFKDMDPYCILACGSKVLKTQVMRNAGSCPVWEEGAGSAEFVWEGETDLHITVMDYNPLTPHDFVGKCCLNVPALIQEGGFSGDVQMYRRGTRARGSLTLEVTCENIMLGNALDVGRLVEATPAKLHRNVMVGLVHAWVEGDGLGDYTTYEVALQRTAEIFGDAWNSALDGIHAETFQEDEKGESYRKWRMKAHQFFYYDEVGPISGMRTTSCFLDSGRKFLEMIDEGVRDGQRRVFTYAITDACLFFSETGAPLPKGELCSKLSRDKCSKHAVHADGALEVRHAGTFRVCQRPEGTPVLVIDNDSGTYSPKAQQHPLLKELLELNFAGLEVMPLDCLAPQPEETKAFLGPNETKGDEQAVYAGAWKWR